MASFETLPPETLLQIAACSDLSLSCLHDLQLTCRRLFHITNPLLHRKAAQSLAALHRLVEEDQGRIIQRVLSYQVKVKSAAPQHFLDISLFQALSAGHFKAAYALLNGGAEIIFSTYSPDRSQCCETREWLKDNDVLGLGSLAHAARSRYHMTFWYKSTAPPYASEEYFWKWKGKVLEKIWVRLQLHFIQDISLGLPSVANQTYSRELNMALAEAATADAHSIDMMEYLIRKGADAHCQNSPQLTGQAWHNALNEEVPALFEAKVNLLLYHGVDPMKVWTWEGARTPIQFFLTKLYRDSLYGEEGSPFVNKVLGYMDYLESCGCLRWPQTTLESFVPDIGTVQLNGTIGNDQTEENDLCDAHGVDGSRELDLIFNEPNESLQPLREALSSHCSRKQFQQQVPLRPPASFRERFDRDSMPIAIQKLDSLFMVFPVLRPSVSTTGEGSTSPVEK
ncbi:hypothetical protein CORC01_09507 [Colletotrichum orchidophilum]|uniref:F-box domain-containing protein n=1 Tax=Colletotrichum orchidophilum TaxID=1209926 RepID=A0A1G4B115_9PEZI|nr:uncharacterized protein CORC01_09507 [Colletotrichum orchidophilum]OHE95120.1 hypothetical protein CORC01_09507 [Colletotrichum orchidophilum]